MAGHTDYWPCDCGHIPEGEALDINPAHDPMARPRLLLAVCVLLPTICGGVVSPVPALRPPAPAAAVPPIASLATNSLTSKLGSSVLDPGLRVLSPLQKKNLMESPVELTPRKELKEPVGGARSQSSAPSIDQQSTISTPGFRKVPKTGVIYVSERAEKHGWYAGNSEWSNLGQGMPETGNIPDVSNAPVPASLHPIQSTRVVTDARQIAHTFLSTAQQ